jgi:PAS domain S-box-containing protein
VIDITQRKEIEEQLRENEQRYRMLFQAATDEIMVFHVDENMEPLPFLEVNDVACDILGYAHDELLQKTLYDIMATDKEEVKKHIRNVIRFGKKLVELQHVTKRGKKIPLEISSRSFIYDGSQTIISIGRDIRERRKLEQEILNISEQERQRIGRDMHDDLGQLLTGVGLIAQNLANELRAEKAKGARKVQEISDLLKEADEHARALTRGLVPVNIESNGLDAALRDLTKRSAKMYDIDIHYNNNQDITLVDTSAVHLYRIAQEAINNAIKHGNATYIGVKLSTNNDHISLSVEDNGSGFPEIADTSDGMGVRIMNFRAQMMGGNLEIKSGHKDGTEIICKIPKNKS